MYLPSAHQSTALVWPAPVIISCNTRTSIRIKYSTSWKKIQGNNGYVAKTVQNKQKKQEKVHTGAMYSSVPTNELDARIGSAKNMGELLLFLLLFLLPSSGRKTYQNRKR